MKKLWQKIKAWFDWLRGKESLEEQRARAEGRAMLQRVEDERVKIKKAESDLK